MSRAPCTEPGCPRQGRNRGLCRRHYTIRAAAGTLPPQPAPVAATLPDLVALGLSYRRLDYWTTVGYLHADDANPGSGRRRHWPDEEIAVAARMVRLVAHGLTPAKAAHIARQPGALVRLGPGVFVLVEDLERAAS